VAVDEAGDDDVSRDVYHLGVGRLQVRPHRGDLGAFDQHISTGEVAQLRVHGDDVTTFEQHAVGHRSSFLRLRPLRQAIVSLQALAGKRGRARWSRGKNAADSSDCWVDCCNVPTAPQTVARPDGAEGTRREGMKRVIALVAVLAMVLVACGGGGGQATTAAPDTTAGP